MGFTRLLRDQLLASLRTAHSCLVLGPRQTGKSTLIEDVCRSLPSVLSYPLQLPSVRTALEVDPESLVREVDAVKGRPVVFIDEIQKVPAIMDVLQYLIDRKRITLVASGSSARKLRRGHTNWLPGRIHLHRLHPLTFEEVRVGSSDRRRLETMLLYGALPGVLSEPEPRARQATLASYAHLYLDEEIRQEAAVRRLAPFSQFLRLAALESGTSPNASLIGAKVGVSHTTIREYFQILEDSLIIHRIPAFGSTRSAVLRKPRYFFFDIGVRNAAAGLGHHPGLLEIQRGLLFEHLVTLEVLATQPSSARVSYFRTKSGEEVDLVVEREGRTLALEIKATDSPRTEDFAGIESFRAHERCDGAFLICQAPRPQKFQAGLALPFWRLQEAWA